jgi:hypothetical protein
MRKGKPIKPKLTELFGVSSQAFALAQSTEVSSRNPRYGPRITLLKPNIFLFVPCYLKKRFARIRSTNRAKKNPPPLQESGVFFLLRAYKPCCKLLFAFPENLSRSGGVSSGIGIIRHLIGLLIVLKQASTPSVMTTIWVKQLIILQCGTC